MDELEQILQKLQLMKNVDVRIVDPDALVDANEIIYDEKLTREEKMLNFVRQIGNPYCYKRGKLIIKASYNDSGVTLEERLENYLLSL